MSLKRRITDFMAGNLMLASTLFSGLLVVAIGAALYLRAQPLFKAVPVTQLLLGDSWRPTAGQFGFKPFLVGTLWVTGLAVLIAAPICLLAAIFLAEFAGPRLREVVKPLVDLLAGIPSVVYGVWAVLVVVPLVSEIFGPYAAIHWKGVPFLHTEYSSGFSVLSGAVVLAIMICPVIISVSEEVLRAVPHDYREVSYALGASRFETIWRVVIRKALPGLVASVVLGTSRALGETMAVLMVVGNVPTSPKSVFDAAYPLPALIANNYGEMMSIPLYDAALLGAALLLMVLVLLFNAAARAVLIHATRRSA